MILQKWNMLSVALIGALLLVGAMIGMVIWTLLFNLFLKIRKR